MKKYFIASICREGVLGGGITADDEAYTYRTNKVSASASLRNLRMKYTDIREVSKGWLLCFPTVTVHMKDGNNYKYIVFRRNLFCSFMDNKNT